MLPMVLKADVTLSPSCKLNPKELVHSFTTSLFEPFGSWLGDERWNIETLPLPSSNATPTNLVISHRGRKSACEYFPWLGKRENVQFLLLLCGSCGSLSCKSAIHWLRCWMCKPYRVTYGCLSEQGHGKGVATAGIRWWHADAQSRATTLAFST